MTINVHDFRTYVVQPAVNECMLYGVPGPSYIDELLVATAAIESGMGKWLHQAGGPAVGVFQIEPASLHDLVNGFITPSKKLKPLLDAHRLGVPVEEQVIWDLRLAAVIARLFYYRVKETLPTEITLQSLWHYYKKHWNTDAGAATLPSFVNALHAYTDIRAV